MSRGIPHHWLTDDLCPPSELSKSGALHCLESSGGPQRSAAVGLPRVHPPRSSARGSNSTATKAPEDELSINDK